MIRVEALIHWLSATIPTEGATIEGAVSLGRELFAGLDRVWVTCPALHGYRFAASTRDGIRIEVGDARMGIHIEVPGEALQGIRIEGVPPEGLIGRLVTQGANFARLDLSIDVFDAPWSIYALEEQFNLGQCDTRAKYAHLQRDNQGGVTLYIGHPQSDRQLRVYNKAAERRAKGVTPDEDNWVRVELQLRNEAAHTAAHMLHSVRDVGRAIRSLILAFADWSFDSTWVLVMRHAPILLGGSKKHRGNTDKWLLGPCANALARRILQEPAFKQEFDKALEAAILQVTSKK